MDDDERVRTHMQIRFLQDWLNEPDVADHNRKTIHAELARLFSELRDKN